MQPIAKLLNKPSFATRVAKRASLGNRSNVDYCGRVRQQYSLHGATPNFLGLRARCRRSKRGCDAGSNKTVVHISGKSVRPFFNEFLRTEILPEAAKARPDYRSSAQKRLMPQLSLKVPVFRRWGKRFFVVVDKPFFTALPKIRRVAGKENSEITWLVYELNRNASGVGYSLSDPDVIFTLWDDVLTALREGEAPQQSEV